MPKISVIVPVYKVEQYLCRCIDSILGQTFSDFELILVDDGSPDNCGKICDEYAAKDERIHVIHQENGGLSAARNTGILHSKSDWICFVDSDDFIHHQMLDNMYNTVKKTTADIVACSAIEAENVPCDFEREWNPSIECKVPDEDGLIWIKENWVYCYWVAWGKLIKKDIVQKFPMPVGRIYEDNAVVFRWLHEARLVAYIGAPYCFYQVNPNGISKEKFSLKQLDWLWALEDQVNFFREIGFKKLDIKMTSEFLIQAVWNIDKCIHLLKDKNAAECIRDHMKCIKKGIDLSSLPLSKYHKKCIWEKLHPFMAVIIQKSEKNIKRAKRKIRKILFRT